MQPAGGNDTGCGGIDGCGAEQPTCRHLRRRSPLSIRTAVDGEVIMPGHGYVAPADHHLLVIDNVVKVGLGPRENMSRPAIDPLFRSVAMSLGPRTIAVMLTGMLNNGAAGTHGKIVLYPYVTIDISE
jgi:chemotaxis response regulator CheB